LFSGIRRWDLVVMCSILGAATVFEFLGVFSPRMVTITQIIKATIAMPVRFAVFGWLFWHFIVSDLVKQLTPAN
jgi:hypothetical protein